MKAKKIFFYSFAAFIITGILFIACKKETGYTITTSTDDSAAQAVIASDELNVNYEFDQAVIDAIMATSVSPTTSGRTTGDALYTTVSGAIIDTTKINTGLIKINYYGKNGDNTKGRTGEVDITLPSDSGKVIPWGTKGAVASIQFMQYEVTVLSNNKSLWLNGNGSITNVSGGNLKNIADSLLVPGNTLADKVSAQLAYTYNDNTAILTTWTWNFNQLRGFNLHDTTIAMTITGDTTISSISNISTSGTTRSGQNFYTSITTPVIQNISSSFFLYNPLSGVKDILGITEPIHVIYGVSQQGNPVINGNPYGYKITWTNGSGQAAQTVIGY